MLLISKSQSYFRNLTLNKHKVKSLEYERINSLNRSLKQKNFSLQENQGIGSKLIETVMIPLIGENSIPLRHEIEFELSI